MPNPIEFERFLEGLVKATPEATKASRALGSSVLLERGGFPKPTPGITTPGLSTRGATFTPPSPFPQPPPAYQTAVADPTQANMATQSLHDQVTETYRNLTSAQEQQQLAQWISLIYSTPSQAPDPVQWPAYSAALATKLAAANDLTGAPIPRMQQLMLQDPGQLFAAPPETAEMLSLQFDEARWARGVLEEVQRVGLDLDAEMAVLPPDLPIPGRIAMLASRVSLADPNAAVGPPPSLLPVAPEAQPSPPVRLPEPPRRIRMLEPHDILGSLLRVAPKSDDFMSSPTDAVVQTQQIASVLSGAQPFTAGVLSPQLTEDELDSLSLPGHVPVHVDNEGRLIAYPNPDTPVEVTGSLANAGLPALMNGRRINWEFTPNRTAPVRFHLDRNSERLLVDPEETAALKPLQEAWRNSVTDSQRGGTVDPMEDPVEFLNAAATIRLPSTIEAANLVENAGLLAKKHQQKGAEILSIAEKLAGPGASPRELAMETNRVVREYSALGSVVEASWYVAESRLKDIRATEMIEEEMFPPIKPRALTKEDWYKGSNPLFPGIWSTLRSDPTSMLSNSEAAEILAHPEPLDWSDPANEQKAIDRIVVLGTADVMAQAKASKKPIDWYRRDIRATKRNVIKLFPNITPQEMTLFLQVLAITSNGSTPRKNFALAAWAQEQYYANSGVYPTTGPYPPSKAEGGSGWGNIKGWVISGHMHRLNGFIEHFEGDLGKVRRFLLKKTTLGVSSNPEKGSLREMENQLKAAGRWSPAFSSATETQPSSMKLGSPVEEVYGSQMFGPKIGAFFLNMNGIGDVLTIDLWKIRTFHRWMGESPTKVNAVGVTEPDGRVSLKKRKLMEKGISALTMALHSRLGKSLQMMDVQAMLWYYEKRLFNYIGGNQGGQGALQESFREASERYLESVSQRSLSDSDFLGGGLGGIVREGTESYDPGQVRPNLGPGRGRELTPNLVVTRLARSYMSHVPWAYDETQWEEPNPELLGQLEDKLTVIHEVIPDIPLDPETLASYETFKAELNLQYLFLRSQGIAMEPWLIPDSTPYASEAELRTDLRRHKHAWFLKGAPLSPEHPLAELAPEEDQGELLDRLTRLAEHQQGEGAILNDENIMLSYNDMLQATNVVFSQAKKAPVGWSEHFRMFSPEARLAALTELFVQPSWVKALGGGTPRKAFVLPPQLLTEVRQIFSAAYPRQSPPPLDPTALAGIAQTVVEQTLANGGFSFHVLQQASPVEGFMVGAPPFEKRFVTVPKADLSPIHIVNAILANADVLGHDNIFLGTWIDNDGLVWIEPSEMVADEEIAKNLAQRRNQQSIWDVKNFQEIKTGGTGYTMQEPTQLSLPLEIKRMAYEAKRTLSRLGRVSLPEVTPVEPLEPPLEHPEVERLATTINWDAITFAQNGLIDLTGLRVQSPLDVVRAVYPDRNPVFETQRLIFVDTDAGEILTQIAVSSRAPGYVHIIPPSKATLKLSPREYAFHVSYNNDAKAYGKMLGQMLIEMRKRTGHQVKVIAQHNHPSGVVDPSMEDVSMTRRIPVWFGVEDALLYGLVTDHDQYSVQTEVGEMDMQSETFTDPELENTPDPILGAPLNSIVGPSLVPNAVRELTEDPDSSISLLYLNVRQVPRLVERVSSEKFADREFIESWTKDQAKRVGAIHVIAYVGDLVSLPVPKQQLEKLIATGVLQDVVFGGGTALTDRNHKLMEQYLTSRPVSFSMFTRFAEPDHLKRAEALAWLATNRGWSSKLGSDLFQYLTNDEKYHAMVARITNGELRHEKQLDSLNPDRWKSKGFPKYFKDWKPSEAELSYLKAIFQERAKTFARAKAVQRDLEAQAARRQLYRRANKNPDGVKSPTLSLQDLLTIQTSTLDGWAKDSPDLYDEWVKQFYKVVEPITSDVAKQPRSVERESALAKMDVLRQAISELEEGHIEEGSKPTGTPHSPLDGIRVALLNARSSIRGLTTLLRMMERPYSVMGQARQGDHPLDILEDETKGDMDRSVFHKVWSSHLKMHQATVDAYQEFDLLARAAEKNERLRHQIHRAMDTGAWRSPTMLRGPEWHVEPIKLGLKTHKVDLSEWLPKLASFYQRIISEAENAITFRLNVESSRYRSDINWLEAELRRREWEEARKIPPPMALLRGPGDTRIWAGSSWEEIHPELMKLVQKRLKASNATTDWQAISMIDGIPRLLGETKYNTLHAMRQSAVSQLEKRLDLKRQITEGGLRRENYITYIHRTHFPQIKRELSNYSSTLSRYVPPPVRDHFLKTRDAESKPIEDWLIGWFLYVPAMMKTIHLEPTLLEASKMGRSLPLNQQEYLNKWVEHLQGKDVPWDRMMNLVTFENTIEEEHGLDKAIKALSGGKIDPVQMVKAAKESGELNSRPWASGMQGLSTWTYFALIGPIKVGLMSMTEPAFLLHELAKRPLPDMPLFAPWYGLDLLHAGADGLREMASWISSSLMGAPRWYSEPTYMGVTESTNALIEEFQREYINLYRKGEVWAPGRKALYSLPFLWSAYMRGVEYTLRASTYYNLKHRAKWYGHDEDLARQTAAIQTNHLIGAFGRTDLSPVARGSFWNPWWRFKRFPWGKTEHFMQDLRGTSSAVGHSIKAVTGLGAEPEDPHRMLMGLGGGADEPPSIPPPPTNPGSPWSEWPDDEFDAFQRTNTPAAEFGASFPTGTRGASRSMMQLLLGIPTSITGLWYMASMTGLTDRSDSPWSSINPTDMSNLSEITALFWVKDTLRYMTLTTQGFLVGLNAKEVKEKDFRAQRLLYFLPMLGRAIRAQQFRQKENEQFMKSYFRKLGLPVTGTPQAAGLAKRLKRKLTTPFVQLQQGRGGPITEPGLLMKLLNLPKLLSGTPQEAPPPPEAAQTGATQ
jgi:hypothetical protein